MDILWIYYGYIMDILWIYYGYIMDILWIYCGYIMDILWIYCGYCLSSHFCPGPSNVQPQGKAGKPKEKRNSHVEADYSHAKMSKRQRMWPTSNRADSYVHVYVYMYIYILEREIEQLFGELCLCKTDCLEPPTRSSACFQAAKRLPYFASAAHEPQVALSPSQAAATSIALKPSSVSIARTCSYRLRSVQ